MRILIIAVVGALAFAGSAAAETHVDRTPFDGGFTNPCTGESFQAHGTVVHSVSTATVHHNLWSVELFAFEHVEGLTADGVHYDVPNWNALVKVVNADGSTSTRFEAVQQFVRDGDDPAFADGDDLTIHVTSRFDVDASGNITRQESQTTQTCS
jgi:hypothetical protein